MPEKFPCSEPGCHAPAEVVDRIARCGSRTAAQSSARGARGQSVSLLPYAASSARASGASKPHQRGSPQSRRLLLVGAAEPAKRLVTSFACRPGGGLQIVGYLGGSGTIVGGTRRLGAIDDLDHVLCEHIIDEIVVCPPVAELHVVEQAMRAGQRRRKVVRIPVDPEPSVRTRRPTGDQSPSTIQTLWRGWASGREPSSTTGRVWREPAAGGPLGTRGSLQRWVAMAAKRSLDLVGALLLLLFSAPILVAAAAAILVVDGRPVLFRQARCGLQGRVFNILKLRTMVADAEARKAALLARNERVGGAFKLSDDPRVTKLGWLFRRTSIDELPQLLNVIRGDMSLVGPRPLPLADILSYDLRHCRRLSVKPGITGLWQVSARREPDFERWMSLDLQYIDDWSLWTDLVLLLRTPLALVRFPGQ
jgi:lipopolysaccharide/colanic/teichoic acid biosynthesis glycosyltransferase